MVGLIIQTKGIIFTFVHVLYFLLNCMNKIAHSLYIGLMSLIVILTTATLSYYGYDYYNTSMEERFYNEMHTQLKPSGPIGHGIGIAGSLFMFIGVGSYMIRKRWRRISRLGQLKYWLEFHIFLCTLGPILVLFHTAFKFGGLVSISFWSMVAVFLSGIIGRFIYIQIPRTIEGRELSLSEIKSTKIDTIGVIKEDYHLTDETIGIITELTKVDSGSGASFVAKFFTSNGVTQKLKKILRKNDLSRKERIKIINLVKNEINLNRRIERLTLMQNLFKYWHVAHLPFAIVMLVILLIHVGVTIAFGYRWIF